MSLVVVGCSRYVVLLVLGLRFWVTVALAVSCWCFVRASGVLIRWCCLSIKCVSRVACGWCLLFDCLVVWVFCGDLDLLFAILRVVPAGICSFVCFSACFMIVLLVVAVWFG